MYEEYNRLLTFCSMRHAMWAEGLLLKAGIIVASIPIPRDINISCGQCILFMAEQESRVMAVLREKNIFWTELFTRDSLNKVYEKIAEYEDEI